MTNKKTLRASTSYCRKLWREFQVALAGSIPEAVVIASLKPSYSASRMRKSRRLFPVGPVSIASPSARKKA